MFSSIPIDEFMLVLPGLIMRPWFDRILFAGEGLLGQVWFREEFNLQVAKCLVEFLLDFPDISVQN
jgi:hypothetical protein